MAKILIVDDSIFMRKILTDILAEEGHEIAGEAENSREAIILYKKLKPDIVTMDIIMPDIDRVNAIQAVKDIIKEDPDANILVITAMGQHEIEVEFIQAGAKDFIVKPFKPSDIASAIGRLLKK